MLLRKMLRDVVTLLPPFMCFYGGMWLMRAHGMPFEDRVAVVVIVVVGVMWMVYDVFVRRP